MCFVCIRDACWWWWCLWWLQGWHKDHRIMSLLHHHLRHLCGTLSHHGNHIVLQRHGNSSSSSRLAWLVTWHNLRSQRYRRRRRHHRRRQHRTAVAVDLLETDSSYSILASSCHNVIRMWCRHIYVGVVTHSQYLHCWTKSEPNVWSTKDLVHLVSRGKSVIH